MKTIKPGSLSHHHNYIDPDTGETTRVQIGLLDSGYLCVRVSESDSGTEHIYGPFCSYEEADAMAHNLP